MTQRNKNVSGDMEKHALSMPDREVCGFVYQNLYYPLRNVMDSDRSFYADPVEVAYALAHFGEPSAIFHTHPTGFDSPSETDKKLTYYTNSTILIGTLCDGKLNLKEYSSR